MLRRRLFWGAAGFLAGGLTVAALLTFAHGAGWLGVAGPAAKAEGERRPAGEPKVLKLSPQARKNLGLVVGPVELTTYRRSVEVPGVVVDRPGASDRGVTAPAVGVVTRVHAFPGDTVKPGDRLFTLRLLSEYLQNSQTELFKATREAQMVREQKERLKGVAQSGAIPSAKLIELDNQLRRLSGAALAYRQDLLARGLSPAHLDGVAQGKFVSEI